MLHKASGWSSSVTLQPPPVHQPASLPRAALSLLEIVFMLRRCGKHTLNNLLFINVSHAYLMYIYGTLR